MVHSVTHPVTEIDPYLRGTVLLEDESDNESDTEMEVSYDELHSVPKLRNIQPPAIELEDLVRMHFEMPVYEVTHKATVEEMTEDEKYIVKVLDDNKHIMFYNNIIIYMNRDDNEGEKCWTCEQILGHRTRDKKLKIKVLWDTREFMWDSIRIIRESDPITLPKYAN